MRISAKQSLQQPKTTSYYRKAQTGLICLMSFFLWAANTACCCRPVNIKVGSATFQSQCAPTMTITVTSAEDGGTGSLRDVIKRANESPGPDVINFNLPNNRLRIALRSSLPPIRNGVTINGFNKSGGMVEINGSGISEAANGLAIVGSDNAVQGLVISGFRGYGVLISRSYSDKASRDTVPVSKRDNKG